jgi:hypothetical protein
LKRLFQIDNQKNFLQKIRESLDGKKRFFKLDNNIEVKKEEGGNLIKEKLDKNFSKEFLIFYFILFHLIFLEKKENDWIVRLKNNIRNKYSKKNDIVDSNKSNEGIYF